MLRLKPLVQLRSFGDHVALSEQRSDARQVACIVSECATKGAQRFDCAMDQEKLESVTFEAVGSNAEALTAHDCGELELELRALIGDYGNHLLRRCIADVVALQGREQVWDGAKICCNLLHYVPSAPPSYLAESCRRLVKDGFPLQFCCARLRH